MKNEDALDYAVKGVKGKKLRTWLTLIGIIIGILTIVVIVSIGEGVKKDITDQLEEFGSDKIIIMPMSIKDGFSAGSMTSAPNKGKLFEKDVDRIEKIAGVDTVTKIVYGRMSLGFKDKEITSAVYAVSANMFGQWGDYMEIEEGRIFKESEENVVVLGNDAANELFGKDKLKVGSILYINEEKFRVVGILKKIGSSMSQTDDSAIYIPFDKGVKMLGNSLAKNEISMIYVDVEDEGFDINAVKEEIEFELSSSHKVKLEDADFSVITSDMMMEMIGGIIGTLELFLLAIAGIASVVSGAGIMNTMFMSIMEKTKEIGVLKAVGATEADIMKIFVFESFIIGGVGGVIGAVIGVLLSQLVNAFGILSVVTPELMIGSIMFAVLIGVSAGYIPARRAARMKPIEALRK